MYIDTTYSRKRPIDVNISRIQQKSSFYGFFLAACVDNGSHNVSRWMTWLPISLKNAVKCDKWYQLQNHSITESLNANGAWEKLYCVIPVHAIFSVSNKKQHTPPPLFSLYMYNIYVGARGGVCLCCAHIYIYTHTYTSQSWTKIHTCTLFSRCACGKTPLWWLQSSLSLLSPLYSLFSSHFKRGERRGFI